MGVTNRASFALGFESTPGVLPGTPTAVKYPLRGENFANPLTYEESGEFRDDRLTTPYDLTAEDCSGGFDVNMRCEMFDPLIAAAFYSSWGIAPTRDNAEGSYITGVTTSDDTYAVAAGGGTPFVAGQLAYAENFTDAANNGLKHATTGSSDTALVVTENLADETPGGTARVYVCGFYGASGDISATSSGLASSTLDFTTLTNLVVGGWIKIGATGAGNRFATAALNTWARVTAIDTNAVTLDNLPSGWTTDAGTSKTIHVFTTEILTIGDGSTKSTLHMQKKLPISGGAYRYMNIYGLHPSLFRLNTTARGRMIARFEYLGMRGEATGLVSTPNVASPSTPRKRIPLVSGRSFVRLHEGGGAFASTVSVPQINFQLQNQMVPTEDVTQYGYEDIDPAEAQVQLSGNLNFKTESLFNKYRASTETSFSAVIQQATGSHLQGYVVEAITGLLTQSGIELSGPNQIITMPFTFTAHANEGSITANKQYAWHRARYFEA